MNVICFNLIRNEVNWSLLNSGVWCASVHNTCSAALLLNGHCAQRLKKEEEEGSTVFSVQSFKLLSFHVQLQITV
jgi:hypothetical protein